MKFHTTIITLSLVTILPCTSTPVGLMDNVDEVFNEEFFEKWEVLIGENIGIETPFLPTNIFYQDYLLFIASAKNDKNLTVYHCREEYKELGKYINKGQGPEEMSSIVEMQFNEDGSFWTYDLVSMNLKKYRLEVKSDSTYITMKESVRFELPSVFNPLVIDDRKIVATTCIIQELPRFLEFDITGAFVKRNGSYPSYEREIPNTAICDVFSGHSTLNPNGDIFLLAYDYTDLIEFYNSDSDLIKRIQEPHIFYPNFELVDRNGNLHMQRTYAKTRLAYQGASSSETEILLLYGNGDLRKAGLEGIHYNHMVLMDWEGTPLKYFELSEGITSFSVDWSDRIIYGLQRTGEPAIVYKFTF